MEILIVDDSEVIQNSLKKMIKELESISLIHCVSNITDAKFILETSKAVVVITDIRMPNGNGFDLLEYINKNHKELKTIMITNYAYPQFKEKALKLGVDHFLSKTNELDRLIPILSSMSKQ
jgi:YesN/AraC family two-component response regulator